MGSDLTALAVGFLAASGYTAEERDPNFVVAERPRFGGAKETICVWIVTTEARQGRDQGNLEAELTGRFRGAAKKFPGSTLYLLVERADGFTQNFLGQVKREFGVAVRVPVQFFDMPFRWDQAGESASAVRALRKAGDELEPRRVPQAYALEGDRDTGGDDLARDLRREIGEVLAGNDARIWFVVAPAGQGKSILFASVFAQLHRAFIEAKARHERYPRPLPMLPEHIRVAPAANVEGLISAFLSTDVAAPCPRPLFDWMIDNRVALWMLDGLDEVITQDPNFLAYIEDRLTAPGSRPAILICVRDSLFNTSDEIAEFLDYYRSVVRIWRLKPWDERATKRFAEIRFGASAAGRGAPAAPTADAFLRCVRATPELRALCTSPFYANLVADSFAAAGGDALGDELQVLDRAITAMCRREYEKHPEVLQEDRIPLAALREWLELLAAGAYEQGGLPVAEVRDLATLLGTSPGTDDAMAQRVAAQIEIAPFLVRGAASDRVEFAHEILGEFLAARHFLWELDRAPARLLAHLALRPWPADSIILRVLAQAAPGRVQEFAAVAESDGLPPNARRNLAQWLALVPGGEQALRGAAITLENARLAGVRFTNLDLSGISLRGADLTNAEFSACTLRNARLEGAVWKNTALRRLPAGGLRGAGFGDGEQFESISLDDGRRLGDLKAFRIWVAHETGTKPTTEPPCPTAMQIRRLFRKFTGPDGHGKRDWLDRRGVQRGKDYSDEGAAPMEKCVTSCEREGYFVPSPARPEHLRRASGAKYDEMTAFVTSGRLSVGLRTMLDRLCTSRGCAHRAG